MSKIVFLHHCYLALRSRSKVKVKGQGHGSRSTFWRVAVDIRGSALPSAENGNRNHYQFKVFVCVSLISGRIYADNCAYAVDRCFNFLIWVGVDGGNHAKKNIGGPSPGRKIERYSAERKN